MKASMLGAFVAAFAVVMTLAACTDEQKSVTFDPKADVFAGQPDHGTLSVLPGRAVSARTLNCTKEIDGTCMQKTCRQSTDGMADYGVPYDCGSYAAACINAGEHWSGTKEGGTCTRVL
jgi:hypothetical protein